MIVVRDVFALGWVWRLCFLGAGIVLVRCRCFSGLGFAPAGFWSVGLGLFVSMFCVVRRCLCLCVVAECFGLFVV